MPQLLSAILFGGFFLVMSRLLVKSQILLWLTVVVAAWLAIGTGINNVEFISTPNPLSKGEWMMFAIFAGMLGSLIIVLIWARRAIPISKVREIRGFEPIMPSAKPNDPGPANGDKK